MQRKGVEGGEEEGGEEEGGEEEGGREQNEGDVKKRS